MITTLADTCAKQSLRVHVMQERALCWMKTYECTRCDDVSCCAQCIRSTASCSACARFRCLSTRVDRYMLIGIKHGNHCFSRKYGSKKKKKINQNIEDQAMLYHYQPIQYFGLNKSNYRRIVGVTLWHWPSSGATVR